MKKVAIKLYINILVFFLLSFPSLSFSQDEASQKIKDIREDIHIVNLLNGLDLRKEQAEFIIQKAEETRALRNATLSKITAYEAKASDIYNAIKEEVGSGKVRVDKDNAANYRELEEAAKLFTRETYAKVDKIAESVEDNLEQFQLLAIDDYKPCIIPRQNQGRIGQVDPSSGITRTLEKIKEIPELRYTIIKEDLAEGISEKIKLKVPPFVKISDKETKEKILDTFGKIRKMEDVDFQLKKESLAKELHDSILPEEPQVCRQDKIKKFLLSERVIPILEERLGRQIKTGS